jgi:hypothetical protein
LEYFSLVVSYYYFVDLLSVLIVRGLSARPAALLSSTRSAFANHQSGRRFSSLLELFASRNTDGCVAAAELHDANQYKRKLSIQLNIGLMLLLVMCCYYCC